MPSKRGSLTSAGVNETIYVFGSEEPGGTFNNNEKYDLKINIWISAQPMPTARHGLAAAVVDDKIYVIGGGPEPGGSQTDLNEIRSISLNLFDISKIIFYQSCPQSCKNT